MKNSIAFVVVSCDRYSDLWEGFFKSFFKYWPGCPFDLFLIANHLSYPDQRVKTICIGEDKDYASNLRLALTQINHPWIFLWLEDCMFSGKINEHTTNQVFEQAITTTNLGYLKLSNDYPLAYSCRTGTAFGAIPKGVKYRSAIGMSLYRKDVLVKLLVPGKNAWEVDKSDASDSFSEDFYALAAQYATNPIFPYVNTVIKGKWYIPAIPYLKREGLAHMLPARKQQSIKEYLYIKAFWFWFFILRTLKIHWYNKS